MNGLNRSRANDRNLLIEALESRVMSRLFWGLKLNVNKSDVPVGDANGQQFRRNEYGLSRRNFSLLLGLQESHYSEVVNGRNGCR